MPKKLFDGDDEGGVIPITNSILNLNSYTIKIIQPIERVMVRLEGTILKRFSRTYRISLKQELGALVEMDVRAGAGLMKSPYITYLNKFGGKS